MTNKNRALRALAHQRDCVSVMPSIDLSYASQIGGQGVDRCFLDPVLHARALENALDVHSGTDGVYINLCLTPRTFVQVSSNRYKDTGGMIWQVPKNDVGTVCMHEIVSLQDERIASQNPMMDGMIDTFDLIKKPYKEKYLIVPGLTGPYSQLVFMLGMEAVMTLMFDDPQGLKNALALRTVHAKNWAKKLADAGVEAVWIGEGAASGSILSPQSYQEFVLPYAKELCDCLKSYGIFSIMHVCGNINRSVGIIAQTNTDAFDVDYMVPMEHVIKQAGRSICIKGNLNPVEVLNRSSAQVYDLSKALCALQNPLIVSTGCLVARDTPKENVQAILDAVNEIGRV